MTRCQVIHPNDSLGRRGYSGIVTYQYHEVRHNGAQYTNMASILITFKDGKIVDWNAIVNHIS